MAKRNIQESAKYKVKLKANHLGTYDDSVQLPLYATHEEAENGRRTRYRPGKYEVVEVNQQDELTNIDFCGEAIEIADS